MDHIQVIEIEELERKQSAIKKVYKAPRLFIYGELRDLTLGGSPGSGDSGPIQPTRLPL